MMRSIAETITLLTQSLADDFHILPLQLPDAPIFMALAVPLRDAVTGGKPRLPAGRGVTLQHALLTAAAEAMELRASLAQSHMKTIAGLDRLKGHAQTTAYDLLQGGQVQVAAQSVYLDFAALTGEPLITDADSTGCATGPSRDDAIRYAALECIERDAVALWWHGALQRPGLRLDVIDPVQPRLSWWLQERQRQTILLDLTTDIGVPVVLAASSQGDGRAIAIGSAARLTRTDAALAAITEMIQTETAMAHASDMADPGVMDWLARASIGNLVQFQPLPADAPPTAEPFGLDSIWQRIAQSGHRVLVVDLTLPADPLPSVRVMRPGLSAMGGRIDGPRFERLTGKPFAQLRLGATEIFEPF